MRRIIAIVSMIIASQAIRADVVVKFDGNTDDAATSNVGVGSTGAQTLTPGQTYTKNVTYSTTVPAINNGNPAIYTGQSIYAGSHLMWSNTSASATASISTVNPLVYSGAGTPEYLQMNASVSTTTNRSMIDRTLNFAALFGLNAAGVGKDYGFDASSVLTMSAKTWQAVGTSVGRWAIVADGITYVSSTTLNIATSSSYLNFSLDNPDAINWAVWNPGADMSFGSLTFDVAGNTISNITHVGYADNSYVPAGNVDRTVYIDGIVGDLYMIPEPATIGMLGVGALITLALRRCRL